MTALARWIDAHCHLSDPRLEGQLPQILQRAQERGIGCFIQGGVSPAEWRNQLALARQYPGIIPVFGLHPWWIAEQEERTCAQALEDLRSSVALCQGIGELGLDFHQSRDPAARGRQTRYFELQLELAMQVERPIVLHVVRAHAEALQSLKKIGVPKRGGLVHAFSGSLEIARQYVELGLTLSIGTRGLERSKSVLAQLDPKDWVVESDAPDGVSEPARIWDLASQLSNSPDLLLERSSGRVREIFNL